jgi:acyl carrier protein
MTTEERVKNVIAATLGIKPERVTLESSLMDDLGGDSLDRFEIVMGLEEEFGIEISDEEAMVVNPVGEAISGSGGTTKHGLMIVKDIIEFIEGKTASGPA